jgi:nitrite reductase/ring-hydroxylating ferredoxin subunit
VPETGGSSQLRALRRRWGIVLAAVGLGAALVVLALLRDPSGVTLETADEGERGTILALPARGGIAAEFLSDGIPVFVVHAEDGDVTVVDARDPHDVGVQLLVGWCATAGWFEGGAFGSRFLPDGRWISGPAPSDLATFETEVDGQSVQVGVRRDTAGRSGGEPPGLAGPTCEQDPPWVDDGPRGTMLMHHGEDATVPVGEAARRPPGSTVLVAGHLETGGDAEPVLCEPAAQAPYCRTGGVAVQVDSPAFSDDPDVASGFAGRFLVRVTEDGFRDVTVIADASSYARAFQGEWVFTGALAVPDDPAIDGISISGEAEPWLAVRDEGDWIGFAPAEDIQILGRLVLTGSDTPTPVTPDELLRAAAQGHTAGTRFSVTMRKADSLVSHIEELHPTDQQG